MLYRFDGSLAARYWLDRQTMVPLRRELFDTADRLIDEDSFVQVQFGAAAGGTLAGARGLSAQSAALPESGWAPAGRPSAFLASLAGQGWRVPGSLQRRPAAVRGASASTASGEVVDLQYSDGLYVVSLFVQRGVLAKDMAGWRQQRLGGQQAWVSGRSVTWAGRGFVYTMVADAPAQTVTQVVGGLPQSAVAWLRRPSRPGTCPDRAPDHPVRLNITLSPVRIAWSTAATARFTVVVVPINR